MVYFPAVEQGDTIIHYAVVIPLYEDRGRYPLYRVCRWVYRGTRKFCRAPDHRGEGAALHGFGRLGAGSGRKAAEAGVGAGGWRWGGRACEEGEGRGRAGGWGAGVAEGKGSGR